MDLHDRPKKTERRTAIIETVSQVNLDMVSLAHFFKMIDILPDLVC